MNKINVAILGVTGYTGNEAEKLLLPRKDIDIVYAPTVRYSGKKEEIEHLKKAQVVLSFLPHEQSMNAIPEILEIVGYVIDLSGAYRLKNVSDYPVWYGFQHHYPTLLKEAVYGLPEINRHLIRDARLIASAGCYETAMILGLWPLVTERLISSGIEVKAVSGYSGAGKSAERPKKITPYKGGQQHQHIPAVEQALGMPGKILFFPSVAPYKRGIEMVISVKIDRDLTTGELEDLYEDFYREEPFVRVKRFVSRKEVNYRNFCDIACNVKEGMTNIRVALDNLRKGASSQIIQNLNIICGLPETQGLL
jgi:N-acetyl-gamma-glutamyl-phosphate reductase